MRKARLTQKFTRIFLCPLLLGIIISISFTVFLCVKFTLGLSESEGIINLIKDADQMRTNPILYNVGDTVYKKFQNSFYALLGIKTLYYQLINSNYLNITDEDGMMRFINKYSFNLLHTGKHLNETISKLSANGNETYLDYSSWYVNNNITTTDELRKLPDEQRRTIIKQIYIMTNMNLYMKSHYEINRDDPKLGYLAMYSGFANTNLFNYYPVNKDESFYKPFANYTNQPSCRVNQTEDILPDYYFFKCRSWFNETLMMSGMGFNLSVTTPYFSPDKTSVLISSCLKMDDMLTLEEDNFIISCIDLDVTDIVSTFDFYNKILNGYFFLIRVYSKYPIYYPNFMKKKYLADLEGLVFDLNSDYYLKELIDFDGLTERIDLISRTSNSPTNLMTDDFQKNGINSNFIIYPIKLNIDDIDPDNAKHLISVIYITEADSHLKSISSIQGEIYPRIIFQVFIFIIFGSILMLISRYLVISIANNIVKPMKVMKRLIQGMNNKATTGVVLRKSYNFIETEEDWNSDSDDEDDEQGEEDFIETRSRDLDLLFSTLIKLKMSIGYSKDTQLTSDNDKILNYVFAKNTFNEVKNYKALYVCDSNVGNLALKCKKYDKAIFHLTESIKDPLISKKITKTTASFQGQRGDKKTIKVSQKSSNLLAFSEKNQLLMDSFKKNFLDSRYPKLIYAYRKYYSNVKRMLKNKSDMTLLVVESDSYSLYEKHSLENYETVIIDFVSMAKVVDEPKKKVEALLTYNEFLLKYRIKSSGALSDEIKLLKEDYIMQVMANFTELDYILSNLQTQVNNEYIKKITNLMKMYKKDSHELIELPIHVLIQKANYLKGVFCMYCGEYNKALEFFNESKKVNIISNAIIIRDSIKKIKKIIKTTNAKLGKQIDDMKEVKQKTLLNMILTIGEKMNRLQTYEDILTHELDKYQINPKDIAILINISSKMTKDSKKTNQTLKLTESIFENLVTNDDRFSLFLYCDNTNPFIALEYKNHNTIEYLRDQIKNIYTNKEEYKRGSPNCIGAVTNVYNYLKKKNLSSGTREKWIIVITDVLAKDDVCYFREKNLKDEIFEGSYLANLILITLKTKYSIDMADVRSKLNFNKSGVVDFDKLDVLKKKMRIYGAISEDVVFDQEKYDNFRK
jgi:hypothetical protein